MAAKIRCAIYTRKSTEEGLEQEFNSLDAQREACSAYILSQRHEGWMEIKESYDDGGFSGGSMGRLTLNVLLSFARFEREVTGERVRDKIAASKAKGLWMGGPVPLGYAVKDRKLVIDESEASTVRHIFTRYLALGSGQKLVEELREQGYRTRVRQHRDGLKGGGPFQRGALFALLSSRIYIGEIVHKGTSHPGEHPPIIDRDTWDKVQALIEANRVETKSGSRSAHISLLTGIICDGHGRKMSPSHATKRGVRYRYYITHASQIHEGDPPAWRIPATDIEKAVVSKIREWLCDRCAIHAIMPNSTTAQQIEAAISAAESAAKRIDEPYHKKRIVSLLIKHVQIDEDQVRMELDHAGIAVLLNQPIAPDAPLSLVTSATKIRQGKATKLVIGGDKGVACERDEKLIALLAEAQAARAAVFAAPDRSINRIASERRVCRHRLMRLVRLSWLAPDIVTAIVEGRQPMTLTPKQLLDTNLPIDWASQKALLGFA